MITYKCPKCGSNVALNETCKKCSSVSKDSLKYPQQYQLPAYIVLLVGVLFIIGLVMAVFSGRDLGEPQPVPVLRSTTVTYYNDTIGIRMTSKYESSIVESEVTSVEDATPIVDPKKEYDDGYKYGYHRGYYDGKYQDEYDPYLPKATHICLYTQEYRNGYAMGYSFGYEEGENEFKEEIVQVYELDGDDSYEIHDFDDDW